MRKEETEMILQSFIFRGTLQNPMEHMVTGPDKDGKYKTKAGKVIVQTMRQGAQYTVVHEHESEQAAIEWHYQEARKNGSS
jgi:hypothetical protein